MHLLLGVCLTCLVQEGPGLRVVEAAGWARPMRFESRPAVLTGPQAGRPVAGDVNSDGKLDLVVPCGACCGQKPDPGGGHIALLIGDGKGGFERREPVKVGPTALVAALADFNEDGFLDVACGEHDSYRVTVLLGDGTGGLIRGKGSEFASREGSRPHTHSIAAADMNGDRHADLVIGNANDATLAVWLGDGHGGFTPAAGSPYRSARHPYEGLRLKDMDGDGKMDAVVPDLRSDAVSIVYGDGTGKLAIPPGDRQVHVGTRPGFVCVGDVNGDGHQDLCATHDDVGLVHVMLGDGKEGYAAAPGSPVELSKVLGRDWPAWGAELADADGDGRVDLWLAGVKEGVLVLRGDGAGRFGAAKIVLPCGKETSHLVVGDFDGDGRMDVAGSNYKSGNLSTWVQVNSGTSDR